MAALAIVASGAQVQWTKIDDAVPTEWMMPLVLIEHLPRDERWLGQFTPSGIPLVVACHLANSTVFFFSIVDESQLQIDGMVIDPMQAWQRIQVLGL